MSTNLVISVTRKDKFSEPHQDRMGSSELDPDSRLHSRQRGLSSLLRWRTKDIICAVRMAAV